MNQQANIRQVVKTLVIRKSSELTRFQIRHPENACALTGISVSTSQSNPNDNSVCGELELFIADRGDLAFTEELRFDTNNYRDILESTIGQPIAPRTFGWSGTLFSFFKTHYRITQAVMEGLYLDLSKNQSDGRFNSYTIHLYLEYELLKTS